MAWKDGFRMFLEADPERLHFAAHSHHFWPDVTFEAHQRAWLDAARLADEKWDVVFAEVWPEAQRHIAARALAAPGPSSIVFAPNTHELVLRLLSCLPDKPKVVTTDSEFHSFERQTRRLEEDGLLDVTRVPSEPFATFDQRLVEAAKGADLVFFSHVFFNSGAEVEHLDGLVDALPPGRDGGDRRVPRLRRGPDQPAPRGRARLLPGRWLQVRDERGGRVLPPRAARRRSAAARGTPAGSRPSTRSREGRRAGCRTRRARCASWARRSIPRGSTASTPRCSGARRSG